MSDCRFKLKSLFSLEGFTAPVSVLAALASEDRRGAMVKCSNCGEVPDKWQYVSLAESFPLKGGRGDANFVSKCKLCSRQNSIAIIEDSIKEYTSAESENFQTVAEFDCRGVEITDFSPRGGFVATGLDSGTVFTDVNLQEKEWVDYDEKTQQSVGIYEVQHRFVVL